MLVDGNSNNVRFENVDRALTEFFRKQRLDDAQELQYFKNHDTVGRAESEHGQHGIQIPARRDSVGQERQKRRLLVAVEPWRHDRR